MKKILSTTVMIFLAVELFGCASVQKKFTRKPKEPAHRASAIYFEEGPYQKKYSSAYYYKTHFTFWKSFQSETIEELGGNQKRLERNVQEAYSHLSQLNQYLVPEKQAELRPMLDSLGHIQTQIESGAVSASQATGLRTELEKIERMVSSHFYYEKVKDALIPEKVDLGAQPPSS